MFFYGFIIIRLSVVVWGIKLFSPFLFPLLYLPIFSFFSSPLLSVFGSILSCVSMLVGSRDGELKNPHVHLYLHNTIPTDRRSFAYLANFMVPGSRVGAIELHASCLGYTFCTQNFYDLQFDPRLVELASLTLPTMTLSDRPTFPYLVESSKFCGFTKSWVHKSLKIFSLPSIPSTFIPYECTLIMILLVTTHQKGLKILELISGKLEDISH
jgi:hypothetical protein